ncbi:hypothetical protein ACFX2A_024917 [Malus domestica]
MLGLGKEDVKISVKHNNILSIKGEGGKEDNVGERDDGKGRGSRSHSQGLINLHIPSKIMMRNFSVPSSSHFNCAQSLINRELGCLLDLEWVVLLSFLMVFMH